MISKLKLGDVVEIIESPYPELFPSGTLCVVWEVKPMTHIKRYGVIDIEDDSEEPKVGWFETEQLKLVREQ